MLSTHLVVEATHIPKEGTVATINLEGLDKSEVLAALYNASKPQGAGFMHFDPSPMSVNEARTLLEQDTDFDYLKGRVMKISLSGDTLDPWLYNRDNGDGAAEQAIESLRGTGDVNGIVIRAQHASATQAAADDVLGRLDEKNTVTQGEGVATFTLGLGDLADYIRPRAEEARRSTRSPLD